MLNGRNQVTWPVKLDSFSRLWFWLWVKSSWPQALQVRCTRTTVKRFQEAIRQEAQKICSQLGRVPGDALGLLWLSLSQKASTKNPNFVDMGKKMLFQPSSASAVSPKVTQYTSNANVLDLGIAFEEHVSTAYLLWSFLHADSLGIYINYRKDPVANPMKTMESKYAWILIINTKSYQRIK